MFQWDAANLRPDPGTSGGEASAGGDERAGETADTREPGENGFGRPQGAALTLEMRTLTESHTSSDHMCGTLALESVSSLTGCLLSGRGEEEGGAAASAGGDHAHQCRDRAGQGAEERGGEAG